MVSLHAEFVPFTAQTRMSGVNLGGRQLRKGAGDSIILRKGAGDSIIQWVKAEGGGAKQVVDNEVDQLDAGDGGRGRQDLPHAPRGTGRG
jgi:K+-transporting ATPase ATPase B chain